ncbi:hypothetical protein C820_000970 [Clostridium sp. MD294]|nr:hypothetical protein C820_000970 [Clostridium sp. MD294]
MRKKCLFFCIVVCMILFIIIDFKIYTFKGITSSNFKFLAMILLFFTANRFKKMILSYTIFCDFLLLFTSWYCLGVAFFTIVHILYLCQMQPFLEYEKRQQECMIMLLPFGILLSFLPLYSIVICYSMVFLLHIISSYAQKCSNLYKIGLILFVLCDCCTAISFLTKNIIVGRCIWILYLPSQILLTITKQHYFSTVLPLLQIKYPHQLRLQKKR